MEEATKGGPRPLSLCCEDGEGEICCGWSCPCRVGRREEGVRTDYVKAGEYDFTDVTGTKAVWVALDYNVRPNDRGWICQPRVVISNPDLGDPGEVDRIQGEPQPASGCCEDGEGEICCGWGCPCGDDTPPDGDRTGYVNVGDYDFTNVEGDRAIWVALDYDVRRNDRGWICQPRVIISDPALGNPGDVT